ncbi:hypothetical protein KSP39_PZI014543 [Platanthera zijinensis]|uniref:Uncharacterized protein n=1 Tax=Platanthera zijinensis TaxID=2320716 RepID=A0AAP0BBD0_9ASPA
MVAIKGSEEGGTTEREMRRGMRRQTTEPADRSPRIGDRSGQNPIRRNLRGLSPLPKKYKWLANVTGGSQMKKLWAAQKPSAFGANTPDSNTSVNVGSRSRSARSNPPFLTILAALWCSSLFSMFLEPFSCGF